MLAGCGGDDDDGPAVSQEERATTAAPPPEPPLTPGDEKAALEKFIRLSYRIAVAEAGPGGEFTEEGKQMLREAGVAWRRYLRNVERPKAAIARIMVQAYGPTGLNRPADAAEAAEVVAQARPSAQAYLELVKLAAQAGQARKAGLAGQKAIELAAPDERDSVRQLVEQAKLAPVQP